MAVTWKVIEALPVLWSLSVTEAVIVCVPADSRVMNDGPVPIGPSMLDVHWRLKDRSPSGMSVAEPMKATGWPNTALLVFAGAAMVTAGAPLPTVTWIRSAAVAPTLSRAVAVMMWGPRLSVALTDGPVPRTPSRSDRQVSVDAMLPSCGSVAVAVNVVLVPALTIVPSVGEVMWTVGFVAVGASRKMMSCGAPVPPSRETNSARSIDSVFTTKS